MMTKMFEYLFALLTALFFISGIGAQAQSVTEGNIVQGATADPNDIELSYTVPVPVDKTTPESGYRKYDRIVERLRDLDISLDKENIVTLFSIGKSTKNRDIWALKISSADATRDDGTPKPRVLITGGVHAREWIGVETVLRIAEDWVAKYKKTNDDYVEFLVNNCEIYIAPVMNPDGFVYSQNAFDKYVEVFVDNDAVPPIFRSFYRDGRLRRKNLRYHTNEIYDPPNRIAAPAPIATVDGNTYL